MNEKSIITQLKISINLNSIIQTILFIGIIFLLNLGYYRSIFFISPSQLIMLLLCLYSAYKLCSIRVINLKHMMIITIYQLYTLLFHGFTLYDGVTFFTLILTLLVLLNGGFKIDLFWKVLEICAIFATVMIFIQTMAFYLGGVAVDLFPIDLVDPARLEEDKLLHLNIIQNGLLRPAAFFAEPSHYVHFMSPLLISYMLTKQKRNEKLKLLIFLSSGVVLSTSGMGIALVTALWLFFIFQLLYSKNKKYILYGGILLLIIIGTIIILYNNNITVQMSIQRIFLASNTYNSAIGGRTAGVSDMFSLLKGAEFWIGTGISTNRINGGFIGGIFQIIYQYGVIGAALFICIFLYPIMKLQEGYRWQSIYFILISFFAGINFFPYLFYFTFTTYCGFTIKGCSHLK